VTKQTKEDLERELAAVKAELEKRRTIGAKLAQEAWQIHPVDRDAFATWRRRWNAIGRVPFGTENGR
jgi:hypothetical protein